MRNDKLSNTIVGLIENAVKETKSKDRYILCEKVASSLEKRYTGHNFDYQIRRMNIDTTKKILNVIDIYLDQYEQ